MDLILGVVDFILHINVHLGELIAHYGTGIYIILFLIVFCETGFVVTPFLPGDSLLFAAGSFAALGSMSLGLTICLLITAAVLGDSTNYWIGRKVGPGIFCSEKNVFFRKDYLDKAQGYYDKNGARTVFLGRFMPIFRTFVPFVAGVGKMNFSKFLTYSVSGSVAWVSSFVLAGYFFGSISYVQKRFTLIIMAVIVISLIPIALQWWKARKAGQEA